MSDFKRFGTLREKINTNNELERERGEREYFAKIRQQAYCVRVYLPINLATANDRQ